MRAITRPERQRAAQMRTKAAQVRGKDAQGDFSRPQGRAPVHPPLLGRDLWGAGKTHIFEQINAENGVLSTFRCMALPGPFKGGEKKGWVHPTLP